MRRVGILGGMGPEATLLLMQKVLKATPAQDDADHVPLIVDQNPQVPSRIAHLIEGTGPDPAPVLAAMARRLEVAGAEALAMPCNTAHHFAGAIRDATRLPFLDMVETAAQVARAHAPRSGRVGILGSPALRKIALFKAPLARVGLEPVYPVDEATLLKAIRLVKSQGPGSEAEAIVSAASSDLATKGATLQLIACTEFSLLTPPVGDEITLFDTLDILVGEIVAFARGEAASREPDRGSRIA